MTAFDAARKAVDAARIAELEAELAVLREADRLINDPSNNYDWHDAIEATRAKEPER